MNDIAINKYTDALILSVGKDNLESTYKDLVFISNILEYKKVQQVISSPSLDKDKKEEFILSLIEGEVSEKIINFVKILIKNSRFDIVSDVKERVKHELNIQNKQFDATLYANKDLSKEDISRLKDILKEHFKADIVLTSKVIDAYDGIKVKINTIGAELSFCMSDLKDKLKKHILGRF